MSYFFCPAAVYPPYHSGMGLYVRYGRNKIDEMQVLMENDTCLIVRCPDRDLMFVRDLHFDSSLRPVNQNWDELLVLSPTSKTWRDYGIKYAMLNYPKHLKEEHRSMEHRKEGARRGDGTKWISDSGGYQILTGKVHFLDPRKIAQWYNNNTDIGVSLDIPVRTDYELLERSARVQRRNNDLMKLELNSSTDLMNVLHGHDWESFMKFHDVIYDPDIRRLSLSDIYHGTTADALYSFIRIVNKIQNSYDHIHILGVFNLRLLMSIIRVSESNFKNLTVTSDASSYLQAAMGWRYYLQRNIDSPMEQVEIGKKWTENVKHPSNHRVLPCSCPICSRVRYADVFARLTRLPSYFLMYHNMFEMVRYTRNLREMARELDDKNYLALVKSQMKTNLGLNDALRGLDFVRTFQQHGIKNAAAKYKYFLVRNKLVKPETPEVSDNTFEVDASIEVWSDKVRNHLKNVLTHYESLATEVEDKTAKHGKAGKAKDLLLKQHPKRRNYAAVNQFRKKAKGLNSLRRKKKKKEQAKVEQVVTTPQPPFDPPYVKVPGQAVAS